MRIAHVCNWYQPRLGYAETHLPRAQARLGHEVHLVTSDRYSPMLAHAARGPRFIGTGITTESGVTVHRLPVMLEAGHRLVALSGLADELRAIRPEVVQCCGIFTLNALRVAELKRELGYCYVLDDHSAHFNTDASSTWWRRAMHTAFRRLCMPRVKSRVDALAVVGEPEREFAAQVFGLPEAEVEIIRLGADVDLFHPDPEGAASARAELEVSPTRPLLLYAGKFHAGKDIPVLLDAVAACQARLPEPPLVLLIGAGTAGEAGAYAAHATRAGVAVRLMGMQDHAALCRLFSAADLGVWPGDATVTWIEAMAAGLPVVTSRTSYTESMIPPAAGLLFRRGSVEELSAGLHALLADAPRRAEMRAAARAYAESRLSWQAIAGQYVDLYRKAQARR